MTSGGTLAQHVRGEHTTAPAETHTLNIRAPRVSKRVDEALRRLHPASTAWPGFRRAVLNNDRWVRRYEARRTQRSRKKHLKAHFDIQRQIKVVCGIKEKIHFGFPNISCFGCRRKCFHLLKKCTNKKRFTLNSTGVSKLSKIPNLCLQCCSRRFHLMET